MIVYISLALIGLSLAISSNILWKKRYGNQCIMGDMIQKRHLYKNGSLFGFILFMSGSLYFCESLGIIEGMGYLWLIAPCCLVINNRTMFSPYYTTEIVDHIDELCLYLRPFKMDTKNRNMAHGFLWIPEPVEKMLCGKLEKGVAPVFCIGDPNSAVPTTLSASGIYATDREWKSAVGRLASKSRLIVLCIMDTEGCIWELQHCINKYLDKTLFLVNNVQNFKILNKFLSESNITTPNFVVDYRGIAAVYLSDDTTRWHVSLIRSSSDISKLVKSVIVNVVSVRGVLSEKKNSNLLTKPFKEQKVGSIWAHIVAFMFEPAWYIGYNRWPKLWVGLLVFYFIFALIAPLFIVEDEFLYLALIFLLLTPWLWLSPRITSSCNKCGSKEVTRRANVFLMKWVIVFGLINLVMGVITG